jgi:NAD(P)-dependent dehydrogenase (short-subunit alcohol dehydrogenase family)
MNLDNRTAVIVGGTGDIGHSTARLFIEAGANVIITGRTATRVKEKASALGPKARGIAVDPADESQLRRLFAETGLLITCCSRSARRPLPCLSWSSPKKNSCAP